MHNYVAFCLQFHIDDLAPTPTQLSAYVEFLLQSNISPATVPNFLSGVKHYLQAASMDTSALNSYTLGLTLRSLRITYTDTPNKKAPLNLHHVQKLVHYCDLKGLLGFTLKLAILLGFFGLLRISNLAPISTQKFDPSRDSTRADLQLHPPGLQFTQKWAKNRQSQLSVDDTPRIPLPHFPNDPLDPVKAMTDLYNLTPTARLCEPLLLVPTPHGHYYVMDQRQLRHEFKQALIACDLDPRKYTPHSLRRGGATLLHQQGVPTDDIKRQGLWRSDAVNAYISDHLLTHSTVTDAFSRSVNKGASTSHKPVQPHTKGPKRQRHKNPQKYKKGPNHKNRKTFKRYPRNQ